MLREICLDGKSLEGIHEYASLIPIKSVNTSKIGQQWCHNNYTLLAVYTFNRKH